MPTRTVWSIKRELIQKSKEAALAAIQIYNSPSITFKSESFIVLMVIAWTYLLHAYYREKKIEYRYYDLKGNRRKFHRTKYGAFKYWELERCINNNESPLDKDTANNLRFLIGLRHEIEHQRTSRIDNLISARFQACCLNYNEYLIRQIGQDNSIEKYLSFSLQLSSITEEQQSLLKEYSDLPSNIKYFIQTYDDSLSDEEYQNTRFSYRVLFIPKIACNRGQADEVIEFIKGDSPLADTINKSYVTIKETEKAKYLPTQIVRTMQEEGYVKFTVNKHAVLWKSRDAKNPKFHFGINVADKYWYWYENWVSEVRKYCLQHRQDLS